VILFLTTAFSGKRRVKKRAASASRKEDAFLSTAGGVEDSVVEGGDLEVAHKSRSSLLDAAGE
jgi:hypothetical protein